jgi:hypothetical protein
MIGVIPAQINFEDYRAVEQVKLPATVRFSTIDSQNPTSTRKIDKVEFNVAVDEALFTKPN